MTDYSYRICCIPFICGVDVDGSDCPMSVASGGMTRVHCRKMIRKGDNRYRNQVLPILAGGSIPA